MKLTLHCTRTTVLVEYQGELMEIHPFFLDKFCAAMDIAENPPDKRLIIDFDEDKATLMVKEYDGMKLIIVKNK